MTADDDYFSDDLFEERRKRKKKRAEGKTKGNRTERELAKILTGRFGEGFSRSIGSGNRWGQNVFLPKHAQEIFSGDLIVPKGFQFVLESKGGYDDIDLHKCFTNGSKQLDEFLKQVVKDSKRCGRKPLLAWKKTRRPWLAFVLTKDLAGRSFKYRLLYGKWSVVALEELLKLEDEFFLKENDDGGLSEGSGNAVQDVEPGDQDPKDDVAESE